MISKAIVLGVAPFTNPDTRLKTVMAVCLDHSADLLFSVEVQALLESSTLQSPYDSGVTLAVEDPDDYLELDRPLSIYRNMDDESEDDDSEDGDDDFGL